jgi:hypothetical protein
MGFKRYYRKAKRLALNTNPIVKGVTGGVSNSKSADETGFRSAAAKKMIVDKRNQAGSGQIAFKTEEEVT